MVVDEELESHVGEQAVERLGLRLGVRSRATVGVAGRVRRGALVVIAPLDREVPVQVHAVADGDLAVSVVVAHVLAPQPVALGEGEVVPVGVGDREEPQFGGVHQFGDLGVRAVVVQDVVHQPASHLRRDPLPSVLGRGVQHRRPAPVLHVVGVGGHPDREDVLAVHRVTDVHDLGEGVVVRGRRLDLVPDPTGLAVGAERLPSLGGLLLEGL